MRSGAEEEKYAQQGGAQGRWRRGTGFERSSILFNTSTEASVAVNMVEGGGGPSAKERERPQKFCWGRDFPFLESESDLNRYGQFCLVL